MDHFTWGLTPDLLGKIIAYFFGCISGSMGGVLWRRLRSAENRLSILEEHEQEGQSHDNDV